MTPRRLVQTGNRPGIAGTIFPDQMKQVGRRFGLTGVATILRYLPSQDSGGAPADSWVPDDAQVPAQLQPLRSRSVGQPVASQINEDSTHIVSFDPAAGVTSNDRFIMDGQTYIINQPLHRDTGADFVHRFECREKP